MNEKVTEMTIDKARVHIKQHVNLYSCLKEYFVRAKFSCAGDPRPFAGLRMKLSYSFDRHSRWLGIFRQLYSFSSFILVVDHCGCSTA